MLFIDFNMVYMICYSLVVQVDPGSPPTHAFHVGGIPCPYGHIIGLVYVIHCIHPKLVNDASQHPIIYI